MMSGIIGTGERDRDWHFVLRCHYLLGGLRFGIGIRIEIEIGILPVGFEVCCRRYRCCRYKHSSIY
jgi:hypothetical protein